MQVKLEALAAGMNDEILRQNVVLDAYVKRIAELERMNRKLVTALRPFAARVSNDNGDVTVWDTHLVTTEDYIRAHFALR